MPDRDFINDCIDIYNKYCYPILFSDLHRPAIWPVIVVAIVIFLAVSEIGSQSCVDGHCNHYKNIEPSCPDDLSSDNIDTLISRIKINHTVVGWRRALIVAILLALVILFLFSPSELPDGFDFFLVATILFLVIYFTTTWFQWHWWKPRDFKIEEKLLQLRHTVKGREINGELHRYGSGSVMDQIDSILSY